MAFSETWLNASITDDDISHQLYHKPERKDRVDGYGGVLLYVKETLQYKRRRDIEPNGIECIWIELTLNHKHILFGLFYRPPRAEHFSSIEDSIHLAMDNGIQDIIITGDFNYDMLNPQLSALTTSINAFCNLSLQVILYGNNTLTMRANTSIFEAVQKYIHDTQRF